MGVVERNSKVNGTDTHRFASKGRRWASAVEFHGRKPHLSSMLIPGHDKKYLVVSASLLTRS